MPLTFPSHAAITMPLKLWRPRWFDGVALVVGSASPDFAYAIDGLVPIAVFPLSHQWRGIFLFCLPVTVICCWLTRWAAPTIAAHLPKRPTWLALPDYAVLGNPRPPLPVTAVSATLAAGSHIAWDRLTVEYLILEHASSALGVLTTFGIAVYIGRGRLLRAWHGTPPTRSAGPRAFWATATTSIAIGVLIVLHLPGVLLPHIFVNRILAVTVLGLLLASAVANLRRLSGHPS